MFELTGRGVPWSSEQRDAFTKAFSTHLLKGKYATAQEMRDAMDKFKCLKIRGLAGLRTRFSNIFLQNKRRLI